VARPDDTPRGLDALRAAARPRRPHHFQTARHLIDAAAYRKARRENEVV
jgi:hypothetical protein